MKGFLSIVAILICSSVCAQESIKVIGLKNTDAEAVAGTLKNVIQAVDKNDKDKKRPSVEKMAEAMFKRIDADKSGSLSLKEFKMFYAKIRSTRPSRGPQAGRSDRGGPQRARRGGPDRSGGADKGGLKGGPPR